MPLMQEDIRTHYEQTWKQCDDAAVDDEAALNNSGPVEDAVLYPIYYRFIHDMNIAANDGRILDVGAGSGRWVRYFSRRFRPALLMGVDFTESAVALLEKRYSNLPGIKTSFRKVDFTQPGLELGQRFDLINVMNVLFHIPERDRFATAMANLARHLAPAGRIVTTEYMPRSTMRTNWMLVRSRYDFEAAAAEAGLQIAAIRATSFYCNDPMGLDGPDIGLRKQFYAVNNAMKQMLSNPMNDETRRFFLKLLGDVELSALNFCRERVADVDMPSQKLVALAAA
jgi:SAM-dependent methyltransferase